MSEHDDDDDDDGSERAPTVEAALAAIRDQSATVTDLLTLASHAKEGNARVPAALITAIEATFEARDEFDNGGADQFVWNVGVDAARRAAAALDAVGAIENAALIVELAAQLAAFEKSGETVDDFLRYRSRVKGPYFVAPDLLDEVSEAIIEYAYDHAGEFGLVSK